MGIRARGSVGSGRASDGHPPPTRRQTARPAVLRLAAERPDAGATPGSWVDPARMAAGFAPARALAESRAGGSSLQYPNRDTDGPPEGSASLMFLEPLAIGGLVLAAAALGAGGGYAVVRLLNRSQQRLDTSRFQDELRLAESRSQELIEKARRDADQITRDA